MKYDLGTFAFSDTASMNYTFAVTFSDGQSHTVNVVTEDVATGTPVSNGYAYIWHQGP